MDETMNMAATAVEAEDDGWGDVEVEDGVIDSSTDLETETEPEKAEDGGEQATSDAEKPAEQEAGAKQDELFEIKYNGQLLNLTRDEMTTLAQKGMNYDKIYQRLMESQEIPERKLVSRMAAASGLSVEEYLAKAEETLLDQFVTEQGARGVPEDTARQIWKDRQALQEYREKEAREASQRDESSQIERMFLSEFEDFVRVYPDVREIPQEVIDIRKSSPAENILSAYRKWENAQLLTKLESKKNDKSNRETAPGSAAGTGRVETDPFLAGWGD